MAELNRFDKFLILELVYQKWKAHKNKKVDFQCRYNHYLVSQKALIEAFEQLK